MSEAATLHDLRNDAAGRNGNAGDEQPKRNPIALAIARKQTALAEVLPKHMTRERMSRMALGVLRTNTYLARAAQNNPESFAHAVVHAGQLGLEIGVFGEAHLVPFKRRDGSFEITLIPGYQGLIKLAKNSGLVIDIYVHEVREKDEFEMTYGLERTLKHKPLSHHGGFPAADEERGEITGVYAVAVYRDNTRTFWPMSIAQVLKIRDGSRGYQAAKRDGKEHTWDTNFEAMVRKTAVRALCNWLPKSPEMQAALAIDAAHDRGAKVESIEGDYSVTTDDGGGDESDAADGNVDKETGEIKGAAGAPAGDTPPQVDAGAQQRGRRSRSNINPEG